MVEVWRLDASGFASSASMGLLLLSFEKDGVLETRVLETRNSTFFVWL